MSGKPSVRNVASGWHATGTPEQFDVPVRSEADRVPPPLLVGIMGDRKCVCETSNVGPPGSPFTNGGIAHNGWHTFGVPVQFVVPLALYTPVPV